MSKKRAAERKASFFTMRLKPAWRQRLESLATEQEASRTQIMRWALKLYWEKFGPRNGSKTEA